MQHFVGLHLQVTLVLQSAAEFAVDDREHLAVACSLVVAHESL